MENKEAFAPTMTPLPVEHDCKRTDRIWTQFKILLKEAVAEDSYAGVEMLLQYEMALKSKMVENDPTKYKQKCTTPVVVAAEKGNVALLKLFLKYRYTIPQPHITGCECDDCFDDKLGQQYHRIATLKALSDPLWIALTSDDPFLTSFKLHHVIHAFMREDDSFEQEYRQLFQNNIDLCVNLLSEVKNEKEGMMLMRYKTCSRVNNDRGLDLSFIDAALKYRQKDVVAHPVVQHFITSRIFDNIPGWRRKSIQYRVFLVIFVGIIYPVTTLFNIILPSGCKLSRMAMNPFVKFINGAASYLTFLTLLTISGTNTKNRVTGGTCPNYIELCILLWLVGFIYGELRQLYRNGLHRYLHNGWNWVDISMDFLMLFTFTVWIALCVLSPKDRHDYDNLIYFADGAFSLAVVLSFFRLMYLCQITSYLGLLQLCLGEMIMVILQFAFICLIVLLSFTVAMTFLFHSSSHHEETMSKYEQANGNQTEIYAALSEKFNGIWATLFTLVMVSFSLKDSDAIDDFADGTLIHLWANVLFVVYFGITMIIVLNMLIAMMNNSYQIVSDNLDVEHKYSRTRLWMEYVSDEQTRPVPFNLLPTMDGIKRFFAAVWNMFGCQKTVDDPLLTYQGEAERRHKNLCDVLMNRYIQKNYGFSINEDFDTYTDQERSKDTPFIQKVGTNISEWNYYLKTGEFVNPTSADDLSIDTTLTPLQTPSFPSECLSNVEEIVPAWDDFLVL